MHSPLEYFREYFDSFLESLCPKAISDRLSKDINFSFNASVQEIEKYIGITIFMTLVKTGSVRRCWTSGTRINQVADTMTRGKFENNTTSPHLEDGKNNGRTKKFQPIVDCFNEVAGQL